MFKCEHLIIDTVYVTFLPYTCRFTKIYHCGSLFNCGFIKKMSTLRNWIMLAGSMKKPTIGDS